MKSRIRIIQSSMTIIVMMLLSTSMLSGWEYEVIDSTTINWIGDLEVDENGHLHLLYTSHSPGMWLNYAYWNGEVWHRSTVDSGGFVGGFGSLALDRGNRPHMSYKHYDNDDLMYAHFDGFEWSTTVVDTVAGVALYTSIALDSMDLPRISHKKYTDRGELKYAVMNPNGNWINHTLGEDGACSALCIDSLNNANIVYHSAGNLRYAWQDAYDWNKMTIESMAGEFYNDIVFGDNGIIHISYCYYGPGYDVLNQRYAYCIDRIWHIEEVDTTRRAGYGSSIDLDLLGNPHLSYCGNGLIRYAYKYNNEWIIDVVDTLYLGGYSWTKTAIALDQQNRVHIVYNKEYDLIHAWYDNASIDKDTFDVEFPRTIYLFQNYPNPFNPITTISFDIPEDSGDKQHVNLTIYDLRGRHVKTLIRSLLEAGNHKVVWDGRNEQGHKVSSGIYLYTLVCGEQTDSKKMVVLH